MDIRTRYQKQGSKLASRGCVRGLTLSFLALLAACQPETKPPEPEATPTPTETPAPAETGFQLEKLDFSALPDWSESNLEPAVKAFSLTCASLQKRAPETPISTRATYGGTVSDWLPACSILPRYIEAGEDHRFFEDYFEPFEIIISDETNKLTGYYEPELDVSETPTADKSAPIPSRPNDLIEARLGQFDPALEGHTIWGQVQDGKLILYPERADIEIKPENTIAYADPVDVFFLQIQGSGRLKFPDGRVIRAGFDAHNHRPFGSLANYLIQKGELSRDNAGMAGIRAWLKRVGLARAREAMNVNPRFVFFRETPVTDPETGPTGAAGLPLTPMGSLAVDLNEHPLGVPFFLQTNLPQSASDWRGEMESLLLISQDTGGAIKGVRRGDIFFGWGDEAGARAGAMNHPGRFFVLLPQKISTPAESDAS